MSTRKRVAQSIAIAAEGNAEDFDLYLPLADAAIRAVLRTRAPGPDALVNEVYDEGWKRAIKAYRNAIRRKK